VKYREHFSNGTQHRAVSPQQDVDVVFSQTVTYRFDRVNNDRVDDDLEISMKYCTTLTLFHSSQLTVSSTLLPPPDTSDNINNGTLPLLSIVYILFHEHHNFT